MVFASYLSVHYYYVIIFNDVHVCGTVPCRTVYLFTFSNLSLGLHVHQLWRYSPDAAPPVFVASIKNVRTMNIQFVTNVCVLPEKIV